MMITNFQIFEKNEIEPKSYQELGIIPEAGDYLTVAFQYANGMNKVGIMYIQKVFRASFDWNWTGQMGKFWASPHTMRSKFKESVLFDKVLYHGKDLNKAVKASGDELVKLRFDL